MPSVTLIACPVIDMDSFINTSASVTGRIITTGLDVSKLKLKHHKQFLALIGQLKNGKAVSPSDIDYHTLNNHISLTFLINDSVKTILRLSEFGIILTTTRAKKGLVAVATGTVNQWLDVRDAKIISIQQHLIYLGL